MNKSKVQIKVQTGPVDRGEVGSSRSRGLVTLDRWTNAHDVDVNR